ncbi:elongation factor 1-gamma-like protein [Tanacetum coccineum]|uniref:Elongation factor 1-gamma-like protein n=1 Tax=Tanacetum coccineum TaxID=301880 RepID=A0ABQ5CT06_9ASTR
MALIMHSGPGNKNVYQALIAAEYVGVDIKMADNFQMGSNAIAYYVARGSSLLGSSAVECGQIEQWIAFSSFELDANLRGWVLPRLGYANYIKPVEESYVANTKRVLTALNTHLATHTFLVGDSVTLADIITTCNLLYGIKMLMPKSFTSEYPNVERYFWTMVDQPNFKKVIGEVKQVEAVLPLPSAKKSEQPKEVIPKAKPRNVEAPKPAVEEEEEAPKPKAKNPLDFCRIDIP